MTVSSWPKKVRALTLAVAATGLISLGNLATPALAADAGTAVTVGTQQITFSPTAHTGAVGSVGGYDILAFNLETGQGGMGGDVQMGSGTLSGNLEVVPSNDVLSAAPTYGSVTVTPGETLIDKDSAGNYVLLTITGVTAQTISFTYEQQASVAPVSSSSSGQGAPAPVDLTSSAQVITAGSQEITFTTSAQSGEMGSVGGYDVPAFDLTTGKSGMGGDVQFGSDASGNPTLSGTLEAVTPGTKLPSAPTSATLAATPGTLMLVTDSAGAYALLEVTKATPQTVWFSYVMQASVKTLAPPPQTTTGSGQSGSPSGSGSGSSSSTPSGTSPSSPATHDMVGNCITLPGTNGQGALGVGVVLTPMFSGTTLADAAQNMELVLHVGIAAPSDVTNVTVEQSGQIGGIPYWTYLHAYGNATASDWPFSLQQTNRSETYQILIKSPTLTAAGLADPSTGAVELDWHFNLDSGCGASTPSTTGSKGSTPQGSTSGSSAATAGGTPSSSAGASSSGSSGSAKTIQLQPGSATARVNGNSETINGAAPTVTPSGYTMVPFRFIGDVLGAKVGWDPQTQTASYHLGPLTVDLVIGQPTVTVNGQTQSAGTAAEIVNGSTLVPLRFVSQALGAKVGWNATTNTVTITYTPQLSLGSGNSSTPTGGTSPSSGGSSPSTGSATPSSSGASPSTGGSTSSSALASQYECGSFAISTGAAGACSTEPWIKLQSDGTYTWGSDQGTYQSQGGTVTFSGSLGKWGPATVNASQQLVFSFTENSEDYRIVYYPHP